jgi:hypothetical protein
MRSRTAVAGWAVTLVLSACAAPPPAAADDPFTPVRNHLAAIGRGAEFRDFRIVETDSPYLRRFRELARDRTELREFAFHGACWPGSPEAQGAMRIDRVFLALAHEATPFDEWDPDAMVELARRLGVVLADEEDVRWFLHAGAALPPIDLMPSHETSRWNFRIGRSGVPGSPP